MSCFDSVRVSLTHFMERYHQCYNTQLNNSPSHHTMDQCKGKISVASLVSRFEILFKSWPLVFTHNECVLYYILHCSSFGFTSFSFKPNPSQIWRGRPPWRYHLSVHSHFLHMQRIQSVADTGHWPLGRTVTSSIGRTGGNMGTTRIWLLGIGKLDRLLQLKIRDRKSEENDQSVFANKLNIEQGCCVALYDKTIARTC